MKKSEIGEGSLILLFWISIWWLISLHSNALIVPSPSQTLRVLIDLGKDFNTYVIVFSSLLRVFISLLIGIGLGIILGLIAGFLPWVRKLIQPIILVIKSTPVVSFIIILLIYVDRRWVPSICGLLLCFPIIYSNMLEGYQMVDSQLISLSKVYKVSFSRMIRMLYLPSTLPYLFVGILTSIGICWKATIAAEVISFLEHSIGYEILNGKVLIEYDHIFAWTGIIIICSLLIEQLAKYCMKHIKFYERLKEV